MAKQITSVTEAGFQKLKEELDYLKNVSLKKSVTKLYNIPGLCSLTGACKRFPNVVFTLFEQEKFYRGCGICLHLFACELVIAQFTVSDYSCGNYSCIVNNKDVSRFEIVDNISENVMLYCILCSVKHHKS